MDSLAAAAAATFAATGGLPSTAPSLPSSQGGMEDLLPLVLQLTNADQVSLSLQQPSYMCSRFFSFTHKPACMINLN
jgi:hypothetical protein